jgi:hypothetical protein
VRFWVTTASVLPRSTYGNSVTQIVISDLVPRCPAFAWDDLPAAQTGVVPGLASG